VLLLLETSELGVRTLDRLLLGLLAALLHVLLFLLLVTVVR
jgi:hypothetical protein